MLLDLCGWRALNRVYIKEVEPKQPVITSEDGRPTSSTRSPDASVLRQQAEAQKRPKAEPWQGNLLSGTATGHISAENVSKSDAFKDPWFQVGCDLLSAPV